MSPRVLFVSPYVKTYRLRFFELLYRELSKYGVDLRVLYGDPNSVHSDRKDNACVPGPYGKRAKSFWIADRLVYQCAWKEIAGSDLVIVPSENKQLLNPMLLGLRATGAKRVAFWGKGNLKPAGIWNPSQWFLNQSAKLVDWWFTYTDETAENLRGLGVSCGITAIGNSMDTTGLQQSLATLSEGCVRSYRQALGLADGPVGIFCGNLSANKRLDFLFVACRLIREEIPDFSLLLVGNGPFRQEVEKAAAHDRCIYYLGPRIGREKALLLRMADLFLLPGAVGLAILDSFAAGLPLITTELDDHGPEIAYLRNGENGAITPHQPETYARHVITLLRDHAQRARLQAGATASGYEHSLEKMVRNFRAGILECLAQSNGWISPASTRGKPPTMAN